MKCFKKISIAQALRYRAVSLEDFVDADVTAFTYHFVSKKASSLEALSKILTKKGFCRDREPYSHLDHYLITADFQGAADSISLKNTYQMVRELCAPFPEVKFLGATPVVDGKPGKTNEN